MESKMYGILVNGVHQAYLGRFTCRGVESSVKNPSC